MYLTEDSDLKLAHGTGKTAPRLVRDLLSYDARKLHPSGRNVLTDPAPQYQTEEAVPEVVVEGSCRHKYMKKPDQSNLPRPETKPNKSTVYKVASFCQECRCHLLLIVDHSSGNGERPCPSSQYPLHHFLYVPQGSSGRRKSVDLPQGERWTDQQRFRCSSPSCPVTVTIQTRPPRLTPEWERLLTDEALVRERADAVMKMATERFEGIAYPLPINVLMNLRTYIANALRYPEVKKIASLNKKFVTNFGDYGQPCRELLEYLGFTYDV